MGQSFGLLLAPATDKQIIHLVLDIVGVYSCVTGIQPDFLQPFAFDSFSNCFTGPRMADAASNLRIPVASLPATVSRLLRFAVPHLSLSRRRALPARSSCSDLDTYSLHDLFLLSSLRKEDTQCHRDRTYLRSRSLSLF